MMSQDSRLAYHAVPRIIPNQDNARIPIQDTECETSLERGQSLNCLEKYLSYSRINVNIRQVEGPAGRFPVR